MRQPASKRRKVAVGLVAVALIFGVAVTRPASHLASVAWRDADDLVALPAGYLDDASRMNASRVAKLWPAPVDLAQAETQLRKLLRRAREQRLHISIAGARHSMGGHTISPDGIVIDMTPLRGMSLDEPSDILTVQAGALWSDVIPFLDQRDRSVSVMQSNNSFTVGGSLSVNCHGWQYGKPPISSTVESFRIMLADGELKMCSRTENRELFSLALGGYGLFGVILDAKLHVVPNERYRLAQFVVPAAEALTTFDQHVVSQDGVAMAYGRMGIAPSSFLDDVIINVLYQDPAPDGDIPPLETADSGKLRRHLFRGSVGSDYGKELRWSAEAKLQPRINHQYFSRNQLLNEGVETFQNRSAASTDVLHEYFIPRDGAAQFIAAVKRIVPEQHADLLNVTIRYVENDPDTFLRYADDDLFAFVMLFNQPTSAAGDAAMEATSRELIDAALTAGGRYYLPYRLHASKEQFDAAYPQGKEFFELKRKYDPQDLFENKFYLRYGRE